MASKTKGKAKDYLAGYPLVGPSPPHDMMHASDDPAFGRVGAYNKVVQRMELVWWQWARERPEYDLSRPTDLPMKARDNGPNHSA